MSKVKCHQLMIKIAILTLMYQHWKNNSSMDHTLSQIKLIYQSQMINLKCNLNCKVTTLKTILCKMKKVNYQVLVLPWVISTKTHRKMRRFGMELILRFNLMIVLIHWALFHQWLRANCPPTGINHLDFEWKISISFWFYQKKLSKKSAINTTK